MKKSPTVTHWVKPAEFPHGEAIEELILRHKPGFEEPPVFVETGCGDSTLSLGKWATALGAACYSLDSDRQKCELLRAEFPEMLERVEFTIGDSLEALPRIAAEGPIDFLLLDSAASAMHTFREFLICEDSLHAGSCLLADNAALPGEKHLLSPCRKGKILVPYLLASPIWEVTGHPDWGHSMVSAILHDRPDYAESSYESHAYLRSRRENAGKT